MQINEEEFVDDIKRFVSENVSLSKISDEELAERIDQIVTDRLKDIYCPIETKVSISQQVYSSIRGFGLLDSIISDDSITEVMINGPEKIFIEKKGRLTRLDKKFESQRKLEDVIQRIVGLAGREVNQANPICDTRLPDIVFYETNADELLNYNIKLNGNALKEGNDYKVTESGGDGSWYRYEYAVNKSLFDDEGEYNLVVESEDKATSMAYSDLKNVSADFVIDKTAPTFTISGIEEDGNYRGTSQNVTLVPTDDGGKLGHVKVTILDKDGKEQKVISDMSGDELTKYLNGNDGKIKFKVPEGVNQQVAILCADCSIGTDGGTNTTDFIYEGITVSSNAFILFFENKPLFYGVLGVVAAAIIVPTGFVIYKKKRKTKKEASEQ